MDVSGGLFLVQIHQTPGRPFWNEVGNGSRLWPYRRRHSRAAECPGGGGAIHTDDTVITERRVRGP